MKYGIRATYTDGRVEYVSSTRSSAVFSEKITNIALFVQESSAEAALKTIRLDGDEPTDSELDIVGISFHVELERKIPYPPKKSGFVLHFCDCYFTGTKNGNEYEINRFGQSIWRATVFKTAVEAEARKQKLVDQAEDLIQRHFIIDNPYNFDEVRFELQKQRNIESGQKILINMKSLEIKEV